MFRRKSLTSPVTCVEFVGTFVISVEQKCGNLLAVFGQKVVRIVRLEKNCHNLDISFKPVTDALSLPDLLWDVQWLYDKNSHSEVPSVVAIATAHNVVWWWDWERNVKEAVVQCEESCILYSAQFFGSCWSDLVLASGTVFNQILLWKVEGKKTELNKVKILHRLSGHEGVIFSLKFNKTGTLLISVSDDRSIRLWRITNLLVQECNDAGIEASLVLYGHTARVWDCQLLESCFVSIGEDLVCNVWSYEGKLIKAYKGHTGRNIWSLAINQTEDVIATGGGDGSLRLWPLLTPEHFSSSITEETCLPDVTDIRTKKKTNEKYDYPRSVFLLDVHNLLIMTNEGCLYQHNWVMKRSNIERDTIDASDIATICTESKADWTLLFQDKEYATYSVVSLSPCHRIVALGNLKGNLKVQHLDFEQVYVELKVYSGKVHSVLWTTQYSSQHLFSCGPGGQMTWWSIQLSSGHEPTLSVHALRSFCLPLSKQRWASAVEIVLDPSLKHASTGEGWSEEYLVVCGDRKGSVHLFEPKMANHTFNKTITPSHSLPVIHGKTGVSHLCLYNGHLYSAGRDGVYRQYRVHHNFLELVDTKKVFKGLDWVERLIFTAGGDLLVAGFHAAFFVLWSVQRNELLWKVKCGGAHRAWDLYLELSSPEFSLSEAIFSYIKDSKLCTHRTTLRNELSRAVLKPGLHGRETTCICFIGSKASNQGDTYDVFVTGSEDTNINLMTCNRKTGVSTKVFTAHGHISSVRALCATKDSSYDLQSDLPQFETIPDSDGPCYLLFSGGGRASLKCWRINLSFIHVSSDGSHGNDITSSPIGYLGEYAFRWSNYKRRRKRKDEHALSEIRFMSLTSLSARQLLNYSNYAGIIDSRQSLYFVMTACSDGFVRIFCFDSRLNKFFLVAQSQYLRRCVLTVSHVLEHLGDGKPLVMLFAGGTAGKIFCWNVSALLLNFVNEYSKTAVEISLETKVSKENSGDAEEDIFTVATKKVAGLDRRRCEDIKNETDCHAQGRDAKGSGGKIHVDHSHGTEGVTITGANSTGPEKLITEDTSKDVNTDMSVIERRINEMMKYRENRTFSATSACSSNIDINQTLTSAIDDPKHFSCVPLISCFLSDPDHQFKAHQSGVNAISLIKLQDPGHYQLFSGGDDGALYTADFFVVQREGNLCNVHVTHEACLPSAHTSSITGVKALHDGCVVSASVDQRLFLWEVVSTGKVASSAEVFHLCAAEFIDIADVQDLAIWGDRDGCEMCVVCGVGIQVFSLLKNAV